MGGGFGILVFVSLALVVIALLALGRYYPGSGADLLDWKPTRSLEAEAELEIDDVEQMLEAQNERRRRRGHPERSLEEVEVGVARGLREQQQRRDAYLASLEAGTDVERDIQGLLEAANRRRARRGEPPLTADGLRAELGLEAEVPPPPPAP